MNIFQALFLVAFAVCATFDGACPSSSTFFSMKDFDISKMEENTWYAIKTVAEAPESPSDIITTGPITIVIHYNCG